MCDKKKLEGTRQLKGDIYKDSNSFDPMVTFQPRSAPVVQFPPPKPNHAIPDMRRDRKIANQAYFQEFTRKINPKVLPPLSGVSSLSSRKIETVPSVFLKRSQESRMSIKSDSKPTRSKKPEIIDAMNASSLAFSEKTEEFKQESYRDVEKLKLTPKKGMGRGTEEAGQVKTPTFNSSEDKIECLRDLHARIENEYLNKGKTSKEYVKANMPKVPLRSDFKMRQKPIHEKEPSSESKYSAIGSSISTDFPAFSPSHAQDQVFFRSYISQSIINPSYLASSEKEPQLTSRREHPQIKVRNSGFPKDVFILKNKW